MLNTLFETLRGGNAADNIDHDDFAAAVAGGTVSVIDVREAAEFASGAIAGAINVPLSSFDPARIPRDKPVVVYCASGARSGMALQMLRKSGFDNVRNYRPGIGNWRLQGGKMR